MKWQPFGKGQVATRYKLAIQQQRFFSVYKVINWLVIDDDCFIESHLMEIQLHALSLLYLNGACKKAHLVVILYVIYQA